MEKLRLLVHKHVSFPQFSLKSLLHEYHRYRKKNQSLCLDITLKSIIIVSLVLAFFRILIEKRLKLMDTPELLKWIILLFLIFLSAILRKFKKEAAFAGVILGALILIVLILEIETVRIVEEASVNTEKLIRYLQTGSHMIFIPYLGLNFFQTAFIWITIQVFMIIRFLPTSGELSTDSLLILIISIVGLALASYNKEKKYRSFYNELASKNRLINMLQTILQEEKKEPFVLIESNDKNPRNLLLANQGSKDLLGEVADDKILEKLEALKLTCNPHNKIQANHEKLLIHPSQANNDDGIFFKDFLLNNSFSNKTHSHQNQQFEVNLSSGSGSKRDLGSNESSMRKYFDASLYTSGHLRTEDAEDKIILDFNDGEQKSKEVSRSITAKLSFHCLNESLFLVITFTSNNDGKGGAQKGNQPLNKDVMILSNLKKLQAPLSLVSSTIEEITGLFNEEDDAYKKLTIGMQSAKLMHYSLCNISDIEKISINSFYSKTEEVSLKEIVDELLSLVRFRAKVKDLSIDIILGYLENFVILCDQQRLLQILLNICDNAIRYTKSGGSIKIYVLYERTNPQISSNFITSIRSASTKNSAEYLTFKIIDNGVGIACPNRDLLFKKFSDPCTREIDYFEGYSGLSVSQEILNRLVTNPFKDIKIKSQQGLGTQIEFQFPFQLKGKHCNKSQFGSNFCSSLDAGSENNDTIPHFNLEKGPSLELISRREKLTYPNNIILVEKDKSKAEQKINYLKSKGIINIKWFPECSDELENFINGASSAILVFIQGVRHDENCFVIGRRIYEMAKNLPTKIKIKLIFLDTKSEASLKDKYRQEFEDCDFIDLPQDGKNFSDIINKKA